MDMQDTLLSDNLVPVNLADKLRSEARAKLVDTSVMTMKVVTPVVATAKVKAKRVAKAALPYGGKVDVHIVEEARVILNPQRGWRPKIHAHPDRHTNMPSLIRGETLMEPDKHPDPNAYDNGLEERVSWMVDKALNSVLASLTASKGTRTAKGGHAIAGFQYRESGKCANGKPY